MKNVLPILLFALATTFPLSLAVMPVVDTNRRAISPGSKHYILPSPYGGADGGGFKYGLIEGGESSCSFAVVQRKSKVAKGIPVTFTTNQTNVRNVIYPITTALGIEFAEVPACAESKKWVVVFEDDFDLPWVGIGGPKNFPGKHIIDGKFKIRRTDGKNIEYQLVFCPTRITPPGACSFLEPYDDEYGTDPDKVGRMVLTQKLEPYRVVFENAFRPFGRSAV